MKLPLKSFFFLLVGMPIFLLVASRAFAGSLYLSPGSKTAASGSTFSLGIRANTGSDVVNAVEANLSYPADKLDFVSISAGASAFPIDASSGGGGGSVHVSRGVIGQGVSGDRLIASVTFRVKSGVTGTAGIGISGSLVRGADQANVFSGAAGSTITLSSAQIAPTSKPTPHSPTVPITISAIAVTDIGYKKAVVSFTTNRATIGTVEYGINNKYGISVQEKTATTTHTIPLTSELLTPGVTYHYRVLTSEQPTDNPTVSPDLTFITKGLPVEVFLTDTQHHPVVNQTVQLITPQETKTGKTDSAGTVTFTNLPPAQLTVLVESIGSKTVKTFILKEPDATILESGNVPLTKIQLQVTPIQLPSLQILILGFVGVLLLIIGIVIIYVIRKNRQKPTISLTTNQGQTPTNTGV